MKALQILVIDGQGGGMGSAIVKTIKQNFPAAEITAVGTNSAATSAMLRAGADQAATGENSVVVCSRSAEIIIGPVGIVIADSLLGEITPKMAAAVGSRDCLKILLPVNHCNNIIIGVPDSSIGRLLGGVTAEISKYIAERE
ncbi:MAG: DUF3842 family protein [Christensenellaceae bacterium]|nr:DUF3842 family protein [Christensenellaceae bacterium]